MIQAIREWFYRRALRDRKRKAAFELQQDLNYLKAFKRDMLEYNEDNARRRMSELKKKEEPTIQEEQELDAILDVISQSKATKTEYNKTAKVLEDVQNYISVI